MRGVNCVTELVVARKTGQKLYGYTSPFGRSDYQT